MGKLIEEYCKFETFRFFTAYGCYEDEEKDGYCRKHWRMMHFLKKVNEKKKAELNERRRLPQPFVKLLEGATFEEAFLQRRKDDDTQTEV